MLCDTFNEEKSTIRIFLCDLICNKDSFMIIELELEHWPLKYKQNKEKVYKDTERSDNGDVCRRKRLDLLFRRTIMMY